MTESFCPINIYYLALSKNIFPDPWSTQSADDLLHGQGLDAILFNMEPRPSFCPPSLILLLQTSCFGKPSFFLAISLLSEVSYPIPVARTWGWLGRVLTG